jgi:hypothetical protein
MELRLAQLQRDPNLLPWLLRAIGLRKERMMIGHIGYHSYPNPGYLLEVAPGGVEFGYTVGRHLDEVNGPEDIFLREVKDAEP